MTNLATSPAAPQPDRAAITRAVQDFTREAGQARYNRTNAYASPVEPRGQKWFGPFYDIPSVPAYAKSIEDIVGDLVYTAGDDPSKVARNLERLVNDRFQTPGHFGGVSDAEQQASRERLLTALYAAFSVQPPQAQ